MLFYLIQFSSCRISGYQNLTALQCNRFILKHLKKQQKTQTNKKNKKKKQTNKKQLLLITVMMLVFYSQKVYNWNSVSFLNLVSAFSVQYNLASILSLSILSVIIILQVFSHFSFYQKKQQQEINVIKM